MREQHLLLLSYLGLSERQGREMPALYESLIAVFDAGRLAEREAVAADVCAVRNDWDEDCAFEKRDAADYLLSRIERGDHLQPPPGKGEP